MLYFKNDYSEGACKQVLDALVKSNYEKLSNYGSDSYTESAKNKLRKIINCPDADIYFLVGGTQTNKTVIDSILKKYEGVIAADTGHISLHEAGAIESTGHKVITLKGYEGKVSSFELKNYLSAFYSDDNREHMVFPGMLYISHPTEYGTLYTKDELKTLSEICKEYSIPVYLDGARLGYGLAAYDTDVTMTDIAQLCDVFYVGGTKVGALCGEAVVFTKNNTPPHFMTVVKQNGALLAKSRLVGVQFDALFTDDVYMKISENAIIQSEKLRKAFKEKEYKFYLESGTNQIFIILENSLLTKLQEKVFVDIWERFDEDRTVVRFATSWATTDEDVTELISIL